ncbi:iron complex outermembrane receptor protein [Sphingobium xanthum]|uniref:TonB-dependent receptor n=1 Tax=Sphingobium xanthum TaxID=1387165 RepID=UPI001C8BCC40|nr:TonB-dependent receptor [Sphingobium xanthum]
MQTDIIETLPALLGKGTRRALVLALASTLALAAGSGARAAEEEDQAAEAANAPAETEEIVVTAQFRREKLQDTPLSITAISSTSLEQRSINSVSQLSAGVPNVNIQPLGAGWGSSLAIFIRGVGLNDNSLSFEPGVPIYIDDVYNGRPQGAILDLIDVDHVEILRGPQGALFGKNAIGGAVKIVGKQPTGDGTGYLELGTGSYGLFRARGGFDLAIVPDTLMLRASFVTKNQRGYGDILDYGCATGTTIPGGTGIVPGNTVATLPSIAIPSQVAAGGGRSCVVGHEGGTDSKAARLALRWAAAPNFVVDLIGDYTRNEDEAPVSKFLSINSDPSSTTGTNGLVDAWNFLVGIPVYGVGISDAFLTSGKFSNYNTYSDSLTGLSYPNVNNVEHWGVSGTINYDLPGVHIKSVTAYRRFINEFGRNSDGTPLAFNRTYNITTHDQFSQELNFTGALLDGALEWAAGGYYYKAVDRDHQTTVLLPFFPAPIASTFRQRVQTEDYAFFVHGIYKLSEKLSLIAGLRYTHDARDAVLHQVACCNAPPLDGLVLIDNASPQPVRTARWSPKLSLSYQINPDALVYAQFSTGFRGGGYAPRPSNAWQVRSFGPEDLKSYELGAKTQWFNRRLTLNGSFFYSDYTGQQQGYNTIQPAGTPGAGSPWFTFVNIGGSRIWGFEAEVQARPTPELQIQGSIGYTDYLITDLGSATGFLATRDANGNPVYPPYVPKFNYSIGAQYMIDLGSAGTLTPRLDFRGQSSVHYVGDFIQKAYGVLDARLGWQSSDKSWSVAVYGTNLTNKYYFHGMLDLRNVIGFAQGNPAAPTQWGLTVKRNF